MVRRIVKKRSERLSCDNTGNRDKLSFIKLQYHISASSLSLCDSRRAIANDRETVLAGSISVTGDFKTEPGNDRQKLWALNNI